MDNTNSSLQKFAFNGTNVNVLIDKSNNPWFIAKEVCDVLGLQTHNLRAVLDHDEITSINVHSIDIGDISTIIDTSNGGRAPLLISESGLYSLIMKSRKPEAHEFKRWVTHEVLPQIRETGGYIPAGEDEDPQQIMARAVLIAQKTIEDQKHQLEAQRPKVLFADALTTSKSSILVGELAKVLRQNGVQIGANRLFSWLRAHKYLSSRRGEDWNIPTQKSMELGLFEIKTSSHSAPDGTTFTTRTPKVTGKGQQYLVNKFLANKVA